MQEVGTGGDDAARRLAVAVGVVGAGHLVVRRLVGEKPAGLLDDFALVGANQLDGACNDGLGALGHVAHDQHGFTEARGLLLHAAGVGEDHGSAVHHRHERQVRQRLDEVDVARVGAAQDLVDRLPDVGVEVHRVEEGGLREAPRQLRDRLAYGFESGAEVLAAVAGDQNQAWAVSGRQGLGEAGDGRRVLLDDVPREEERVDDRVARDEDALRRDPLLEQVLPVQFRGREVQCGQARRKHPVGLFGPGRVEVAGAQACLHVPNRDVVVEGGKGSAEGRGRVALDEDKVGFGLREEAVDGLDRPGGEAGQRLVPLHQVEVHVGLDAEGIEDLVEHLAVLGGDADLTGEARIVLEREDDRGQLDGLGTRAEDDSYFAHGVHKKTQKIKVKNLDRVGSR